MTAEEDQEVKKRKYKNNDVYSSVGRAVDGFLFGLPSGFASLFDVDIWEENPEPESLADRQARDLQNEANGALIQAAQAEASYFTLLEAQLRKEISNSMPPYIPNKGKVVKQLVDSLVKEARELLHRSESLDEYSSKLKDTLIGRAADSHAAVVIEQAIAKQQKQAREAMKEAEDKQEAASNLQSAQDALDVLTGTTDKSVMPQITDRERLLNEALSAAEAKIDTQTSGTKDILDKLGGQ